MSVTTLVRSIFLHGALIASVSCAIGLNHRKNKVVNVGLIGLMFLGSRLSDGFARYHIMNPYWSIPLCIIIGSLVNIALNVWFIKLLPRLKSWRMVSALSLIPFAVLVLAGKLLSSYFMSIEKGIMMGFLIHEFDFTLFNIPGVLILGTALFLFTFALNLILTPVVEDGPRGFDKWDIAVYAVSGVSATLAGVLMPFWFTRFWVDLVILVLAGVFVGGLDKKINPSIGGFLVGVLYIVLNLPDSTYPWYSTYSLVIVAAIGVVALLSYPYGIVGSFRKKLEYKY